MIPREVFRGLLDEKKEKLVRFFINKSDEKFYLREVSRLVKIPPTTVLRLLNELISLNIIDVIKIKKTKLYFIASNAKITALREIFEEKKNAMQEFIDFIKVVPGAEKLVLHGDESKDKSNLIVIGEGIDPTLIKSKVGSIKDEFGITVIDLTLTPEQFRQMSVMGLFPGKKEVLWSND